MARMLIGNHRVFLMSGALVQRFGDLVAGARPTYDWNGAWGYRNEALTGGLAEGGCALVRPCGGQVFAAGSVAGVYLCAPDAE
jgi:hypothetical protein